MVNEHGYTKLWYTATGIRWAGGGLSVTALCLFGGAWGTEYAPFGHPLDLWWLVVLAPLISFMVNVSGLVALFLVRRNVFVYPAYLLSLDLFAGMVLATVEGLFWGPTYGYRGYQQESTGQVELKAVWSLSLVILILQFFAFLGGVRDVHLYRKHKRARELAAKEAGGVKGVDVDSRGDVEMGTFPSTRSRRESVRAELAGRIRVELPDGQILELPGGSRVELPGEVMAAELPSRRSMGKLETQNLHVSVSPVELESPFSGPQSLQRRPATAWSF